MTEMAEQHPRERRARSPTLTAAATSPPPPQPSAPVRPSSRDYDMCSTTIDGGVTVRARVCVPVRRRRRRRRLRVCFYGSGSSSPHLRRRRRIQSYLGAEGGEREFSCVHCVLLLLHSVVVAAAATLEEATSASFGCCMPITYGETPTTHTRTHSAVANCCPSCWRVCCVCVSLSPFKHTQAMDSGNVIVVSSKRLRVR